MIHEIQSGEVLITTDKTKLDVDAIHDFLTHSYWAKGISKKLVEQSIRNSLCFGVLVNGELVGFSRVISDFATFAYLCDVYILESHRGKGLSKLMMDQIMSHPDLQSLRRFLLFTRDAHGLYSQFEFKSLKNPERGMEILKQNLYQSNNHNS